MNIENKDCIFCRIANQEIPSPLLWEDNEVVAFRDLYPKAPVHILIVPRKHISCLNDITEDEINILGKINYVATQLANQEGLKIDGWRLVCNCGKDAGQEVFHLHYHLLGGKYLGGFTNE